MGSKLASILAVLIAYCLVSARVIKEIHEADGLQMSRVAGSGTAADNIYAQPGPTESGGTSNAYRVPNAGMQIPGLAHSLSLGPVVDEERANLNGTPTISDTYRPNDQGTDWPPDAFTRMVAGHVSPRSLASPALHSYDGDGNMEALNVFGPFSHQETPTDLAAYTGAVGPVGRSTPEPTPEITAPDFPVRWQG